MNFVKMPDGNLVNLENLDEVVRHGPNHVEIFFNRGGSKDYYNSSDDAAWADEAWETIQQAIAERRLADLGLVVGLPLITELFQRVGLHGDPTMLLRALEKKHELED